MHWDWMIVASCARPATRRDQRQKSRTGACVSRITPERAGLGHKAACVGLCVKMHGGIRNFAHNSTQVLQFCIA
jgi:hypothetical protein